MLSRGRKLEDGRVMA